MSGRKDIDFIDQYDEYDEQDEYDFWYPFTVPNKDAEVDYDLQKEFDRLVAEGGKSDCSHEWVEYIGVMNRFEYCSKCDEKKK